MKKVKILDVQFDVCAKNEALARIIDVLENRAHESGKQIATPNPEMLLEAQKNKQFHDVLNKAWLSIPDGIGILWAFTFREITKNSSRFNRFLKMIFSLFSLAVYPKFCTKVFSERITGVDLMESICAVSKGTPIFLLGAKPGVAEKVKTFLETKYSGINIVGVFSGSPTENDFIAIQASIAETNPKILFVAYGSPNQELWINQHLHELKSVKIAMGVGGAFDFLAGTRKRAPKWMQKIGLEWLFRLIQEPSRIKRIYNATIKFPLKILRQ
ncbi:WecB/TagA/CpsF family glycosyltransferase [Candidatus Peregrinibacteria bacterium]|nr:WecB/TagA/CpsF family glycosyltransferase [Candidatus Peregrinibacteria bacterium]